MLNKNWWKWGDPSHYMQLEDVGPFRAYLENRWGKKLEPVQIPQVSFSDSGRSQMSETDLLEIFPFLSKTGYSLDLQVRLPGALGKSYKDILAVFQKADIQVPDAVLYPDSHDETLAIVRTAANKGAVLIPFGGGTNVVGAFNLPDDSRGVRPVFSLNMRRMNRMLNLDKHHLTATFEAGILGPELEALLQKEGLTLGHFPQSFEYSTLGGWLVTRSAGQESTLYGKIENMVMGVKAATPQGEIQTGIYPAETPGMDVNAFFKGSEGLFGVVTEVTVQVHHRPAGRKWISALFPNFESGTDCLRGIIQQGIHPSVVRLSDPVETMLMSKLSSGEKTFSDRLKGNLLSWYLSKKGIKTPCILMMKIDDTGFGLEERFRQVKQWIRSKNGIYLGAGPGEKWEADRFHLPYLRDPLVEHGVLIDTLETMISWKKIPALHRAVMEKLASSQAFGKEKGLAMAHLSHIYPSGSCIYFTFLTPMQTGKELAQWLEIKTLIMNTFAEHGAAVTHHHSIGLDQKRWYEKTLDPVSKGLLRAAKHYIDPGKILNPGKLFDDQD